MEQDPLLSPAFPSRSDLLEAVDEAGGGKDAAAADDEVVERAATLEATPSRSVVN